MTANTDSKKVFEIYNSLFLNLSYQDTNHVGHLLPIFSKFIKKEISSGRNPREIIDSFWQLNQEVAGNDKMDFMFKVIQYVERQIVLFDSIEDSISPYHIEGQRVLGIADVLSLESDNTAVLKKLNDFKVRIVLTAHPTQFYRPPVLDIITKLKKQIAEHNVEEIDILLHQLGLTSLVNSKSPSPLEEAKNIIHICRYYYYDAIGDFYHNLSKEFPQLHNHDLITLGFWPCGDRDGNPYVTHETTKQVSDELRMTLMKCYYADVKELLAKLTFKDIESILHELRDDLYGAMFHADKIVVYTGILDKLAKAEKILIAKYESLYLADLQELFAKVSIFKNHFASLDIRQNHNVHLRTVEFILKSSGHITDSISELEDNELEDLLSTGMIQIPDLAGAEDLIADTIKNIAQLPRLQNTNGEHGIHRYIISNSEDKFSVLFVLGLMRWIHKNEEINFDIIPLFETMSGMQACASIMESLFENKKYRQHISQREDKQTMMLGFSDGTKDGGYLRANWSIFNSKEVLSAVCEKHNVSAVFFDGRGGPPARGGGKTHDFYAALGSGIANNEIQLTIQGQTITSTYGTIEKFKFNSEQLITAGLKDSIYKSEVSLAKNQRALIEELAEVSYKKYTELKLHPKFLSYLEEMTPLQYYSKANIGSRPAKRKGNAKLNLDDLRAISYVGSWSQLKQNIPGYFGIGTAIAQLKEDGRIDEVKDLFNSAPFFRTLIDNSMMALTKCFFELTSYMEASDEFGEFWTYLYEEYKLSKAMLLEISGFETLMQDDGYRKKSILMREEIILPLLIIQNYALQRIQAGDDTGNNSLYEKLVVRSLYGNINASRNSA